MPILLPRSVAPANKGYPGWMIAWFFCSPIFPRSDITLSPSGKRIWKASLPNFTRLFPNVRQLLFGANFADDVPGETESVFPAHSSAGPMPWSHPARSSMRGVPVCVPWRQSPEVPKPFRPTYLTIRGCDAVPGELRRLICCNPHTRKQCPEDLRSNGSNFETVFR